MSLRVLFAAGGTGGHIFPAIAVYEELKNRYQTSFEAHWLGSSNRMESTMIPRMGIPYTAMPIKGFRSLVSFDTALLPLRIAGSVLKARSAIRLFKPSIAVVTGAYISYPAGVAARQSSVPYIVMESNVNLGKTNKQLMSGAAAIILSYEESQAQIPSHLLSRTHVLGNPVRAEINQPIHQAEARVQFGLQADLPTIFVVGGSLGSRSINTVVQTMVLEWAAESKAPYQLIWQTGKNFQAYIPESLKSAVSVSEFVNAVGVAYQAADLVVARSGATTVAELGVAGKTAILVPLPSAAMNEQQLNALAAERRGGAMVVADGDLGSLLEPTIRRVMEQPELRRTMAEKMRAMGKADATSKVVDLIATIAKGQV